MIKAVFLDYTGTIIEEGGPDGMEMLKRCWKNSDIESMEAMLAYWWKLIKAYEVVSYKESYITEDEIVDRALAECAEKIHLKENFAELHRLCQRFWMYDPAFPDTKAFPSLLSATMGFPMWRKACGTRICTRRVLSAEIW